MAIDKRVYELFKQLDARYRAVYAEYLEACQIDRDHGHRPEHCEHDIYQWRDYDVICGGCEDGLTMSDGLQRRTWALENAKSRVAEADEIVAWLYTAHRLHVQDTVNVTAVVKRAGDLLNANKGW